MSVTVRSVPEVVHRELVGRAARQGQSLQEYLRAELVRLAERPSVTDLMERVRVRKATTGSHLSGEQILSYRDADRA